MTKRKKKKAETESADEPVKRKPGRPSKYNKDYARQAAILCRPDRDPATDADLAAFFQVSEATINGWKIEYPEFLESLKEPKDDADEKVKISLYKRAMGYFHPAVKIFNHEGTALIVPYVEHYPPDTTACIFWLKNRQPKEWRDRQEVTGEGGGPVIAVIKEA